MITTEEEAKTKRCQESFAAAQVLSSNGATFMSAGVGLLRDGGSSVVHTAPTNCIGSACMAWRWAGMRSGDGKTTLLNGDAKMAAMGMLQVLDDSVLVGFCGKAGVATHL